MPLFKPFWLTAKIRPLRKSQSWWRLCGGSRKQMLKSCCGCGRATSTTCARPFSGNLRGSRRARGSRRTVWAHLRPRPSARWGAPRLDLERAVSPRQMRTVALAPLGAGFSGPVGCPPRFFPEVCSKGFAVAALANRPLRSAT
eukprot:9471125-Pyramimonas_sp.AAC.1